MIFEDIPEFNSVIYVKSARTPEEHFLGAVGQEMYNSTIFMVDNTRFMCLAMV